jgi:cell division protein FtsN
MRKTVNRERAPAAPKKGGPGGMIAGILVGMVLGLLVAAGVAWYLTKLPSPFTNKDEKRDAAAPQAQSGKEAAPLVPPVAAAASAAAPSTKPADADKPRFDFYNVLTDKKDASVPVSPKVEDKSFSTTGQAESHGNDSVTYYLQTGSFSDPNEADKEKARLAMQGLVATVQTVFIPDKGARYRVRLGPYQGSAEMNKARDALKQIGISATPMRG